MKSLSQQKLNPIVAGISGALLLAGCSSNTKLDDGSYRSIGNGVPKQVQNYAVTEANSQAQSAYGEKAPEALATNVPLPDFPGQMAKNQSRQTGKKPNNAHLARFGHPSVIDKIVKTAKIHCQPHTYRVNTSENSFWGKGKGLLTQCTYRFPKHCGAHIFSLLEYEKKSILIYQPPENTHYVIDTLKGTPKSKLGLWDQDDHLGSNNTNAGYFFQNDYNQNYGREQFNPSNLGWIIKASHKDEEIFGRLYHQAVQESTTCF